MMRRWANSIIFGVFFVIVAGGLFFYIQHDAKRLQLKGHDYQATIMRTIREREVGLSGTSNIERNEAALFVFPKDAPWSMWMKDMNYPIDIVWLDHDQKVVYMVKNALPSSYPDTIYRPPQKTRYVIELASGTIERTGITIGDFAQLPSGGK